MGDDWSINQWRLSEKLRILQIDACQAQLLTIGSDHDYNRNLFYVTLNWRANPCCPSGQVEQISFAYRGETFRSTEAREKCCSSND